MLGYWYAIGTAVMWSFNPAFISRYKESLHPIFFTGLRALMAFIPAVLLSYLVGFKAVFTPLSISLFVFSALIGPGVGDAAYTRAIQLLGGGKAVVISYTYIFIAQALSALFEEVVGPGILVGALLAFLGLLVSMPQDTGSSRTSLRGLGYGALASLSWGFGAVLSSFSLHFTDPASLLAIRLFILFIVFLPLGMLSIARGGDYSISRNARGLLISAGVTGIIGWFGGTYFFLASLALVGTASTVLATALTPIISMMTTRNIARESHSHKLVLGAILTSLGIGIAAFLS
ncbi:MAG: DMT family transporter [Zestosphaera sp.]